MSNKWINRVKEESKTKGNVRLAMFGIADCANELGISWPGVSGFLQEYVNATSRTVGSCIEKAVELGELIVYPNPGRSHSFIIILGRPLSEIKEAIRALAKQRKLTLKEMRDLRKSFGGTPPKKFRSDPEEVSDHPRKGFGSPPKTVSDDPLVIPNDPPISAATAPGAGDPPEDRPPRNPLFDAVAEGSFGGVIEGGRIGRIVKYLKTVKATPEEVGQFYIWWKDKFPGAAPLRDAGRGKSYGKFAEHYAAFKANGHKHANDESTLTYGQEVV